VADRHVVRYASWGARFVAWLIDTSLLVGLWIVAILLADLVGPEPVEQEGTVAAWVVGFLFLLLWPLYYAVCHSRTRGQTLGKRVVHISVRDQETAGRLSFGRALGRAYFTAMLWCFLLLALPLVDGLRPLWDEQRQALHDEFADSIVVRAIA